VNTSRPAARSIAHSVAQTASRKKSATRALAALLIAGGLLAAFTAAHAQTQTLAASAQQAAPQYGRWQSSMDAFAAADKERFPASEGVLFVGSSTIRMWKNMAQDFRDVPVVINRGFGGSTMDDCNRFVRTLVNGYKPRHVLVYAGDNDLAEGRSPQQVLESFTSFVATVRSELPDTRITYISIKPSPLRASLMPKMREANALISSYVATLPNTGYIDIHTPMLGTDGSPKPELYQADRLHMTDAGYKLWHSVIAAQLQPPAPSGSPALPAGQQMATSATASR
jgi:lysophospholipase L1-like esterase